MKRSRVAIIFMISIMRTEVAMGPHLAMVMSALLALVAVLRDEP